MFQFHNVLSGPFVNSPYEYMCRHRRKNGLTIVKNMKSGRSINKFNDANIKYT